MNKKIALTLMSLVACFSLASFAAPQQGGQNVENKMHQLFVKFLDESNSKLSYACWKQKLVQTLGQKPKYAAAVIALKQLGNTPAPMQVGLFLQNHQSLVQPRTAQLLKAYSNMQLLNIFRKRISLNGNACTL